MGGQALELAAEGPIMKAIGKVVLGASLSAPLLAGGIHALAKSQGYGAPPQTPGASGFTAPSTGAP